MKHFAFILCLIFCATYSFAQYPPQAELPGSTAMHKDSSAFVDWGYQCQITRGWMDIADTSLGKTLVGSSTSAFGKADGDVISLGDGGEAIYYVENPIINGQGFDFAIFENGFMSPEDSALAYLELAKVSVSNDGIMWTSFNAVCNHDTLFQIPGFGEYMNASTIDQLAGKYKHDYGTPFDLSNLDTSGGLNLNAIHYIKIKDVVGSINDSFCTRDINGRKINDPYPTPFPSGGFDLDALGIIHHLYPTWVSEHHENFGLKIFPNPASNILNIQASILIDDVTILSMNGMIQPISFERNSSSMNISSLTPGLYIARIRFQNGTQTHQLFNKYE